MSVFVYCLHTKRNYLPRQAVFDNDVDYLEILLDQAVAAQEEEHEARAAAALEGAGAGAPVRATTEQTGGGLGGGYNKCGIGLMESCVVFLVFCGLSYLAGSPCRKRR